jgi:hypothetical protein
MAIFLLDQNKPKAYVDRLLRTDEGEGSSAKNADANKKDTIPRPASIHAAINPPSRIYFKAVASNKTLPPVVIYYHSLSSNKQIKDHSVRVPTPPATAATIYYHSLDSNKKNRSVSTGYILLSEEADGAPASPSTSTSKPRRSLSWCNGSGKRGGNGVKPPLSPSTPPPSKNITAKMLVKGGGFQQNANAHVRHPPSPLSPSTSSPLQALPQLPFTQDKPPKSPVPRAKQSNLLSQCKYQRKDESTPMVPVSSTLSSKSSGDDNVDCCSLTGSVLSMVLDSTNQLMTEIQIQDPAKRTGRASQSQGSGSSVKFGEIEIVEFPIRLGDNPSVRFGAPIALGEKPLGRRTVTLEEYEQDRAARLSRNEIVLDVLVRSDMLMQSGFSQKEIRKAIGEAAEARESRKKHAEKFLKEHGWGSILASALDNNTSSDDGSSKAKA